jgi:F-type H+-transporting ATPase subunit gamma
VKNIGQITKAMEVVSMTKMRRAQIFALQARPYAVAAFELFENLRSMSPEIPALLAARPDTCELLIVVTSDKGLAGSFNENVIRRALKWIGEREASGKEFALIVVGKKAKDALERKGYMLAAIYTGFGDYSTLEETSPIALRMIRGFFEGEWSGASIISTHFRTTLRQETALHKILPVTEDSLHDVVNSIVPEYGRFHEVGEEEKHRLSYQYEIVFEPNSKEILDALVPELLKIHLHHSILESNASEHSARMVAMKAASDNAKELGGELNLVYNKARQAGITQELSEVVAGQAALE